MSTASKVSSEQRYTQANPCPVCKGGDDDPRGQGSRCHGFGSDDGKWANCSRPEYAGSCKFNSNSNTYVHRLHGPCHCGVEHGPAPLRIVTPGSGRQNRGNLVASYVYLNDDSTTNYEVLKYYNAETEKKTFLQRRPDKSQQGGYAWDLDGIVTCLYRLPALKADPDASVIVVEGEKDAESLHYIGVLATTNSGGAGKWKDHLSAPLAGREVLILPDNDRAGRDHAEQVAASVSKVAKSVKILTLPGLPEKGDVSDWLKGRRTKDKAALRHELLLLLDKLRSETPDWQPSAQSPGGQAQALSTSTGPVEPIRARAAYHVENGKIEELYRDESFLKDITRLERSNPGEAAAIKAILARIAGFTARSLKAAMEPARKSSNQGGANLDSGERFRLPRDGSEVDPETAQMLALATTSLYKVTPGHTFIEVETNEGSVLTHLADFSARIVEEHLFDDGSGETRLVYRLTVESAARPNEPVTIDVPAAEFADMKWPEARLGSGFRVESGRGFRDHTRSAIQFYSDPIKRTVLGHVGWRKFGQRWGYIHAGGVIFAHGNDSTTTVILPGKLAGYRLPDPPRDAERLRHVAKVYLETLSLSDRTRPGSAGAASVLFAATGRAPIDYADFAVQCFGRTGSLKTSHVAAAFQQNWGAGMKPGQLPASWASDTPKSILENAGYVQAAGFVADDFKLNGTSQDVARKMMGLEDFFQAVGNHHGRNRLNPDGTPRPSLPPGGLCVTTGESQVNPGSSDARTVAVRYTPGMIDGAKLAAIQKNADDGLHAEFMAAYVRWLAPQLDDLRAKMAARVLKLRGDLHKEGDHGRTPMNLAHLVFGAETLLRFARESGAIDEAEEAAHLAAIRDGLDGVSGEIREDRDEELDPADDFLQLIETALIRRTAYIASSYNDDAPPGLEISCGWEWVKRPAAHDPEAGVWMPGSNADRIGWTDGTTVFLQAAASFQMASRMAEYKNTVPQVTVRGLGKTLSDAGILTELASERGGRKRYTSMIKIRSQQRRIELLPVAIDRLWPDREFDSGPDQPVGTDGGSRKPPF